MRFLSIAVLALGCLWLLEYLSALSLILSNTALVSANTSAQPRYTCSVYSALTLGSLWLPEYLGALS